MLSTRGTSGLFEATRGVNVGDVGYMVGLSTVTVDYAQCDTVSRVGNIILQIYPECPNVKLQ